jgi:hypothetical protein
MTLPNGAGGYQVGDGNLNEVILGTQVAPNTYTGAATLLVSDLANGLVVFNSGSGANLALPAVTGVNGVDADVSSAKVNSSFDFAVLSTGAGAATLTAGAGWTLVGSGVCEAAKAVVFRARKTGVGTYTLYRIAN